MTDKHYKRAFKLLREINNFTIVSTETSKDKNTIKHEYEEQHICLGKYKLIVSGSAEYFYSINHSSDKIFLLMSLFDSEENDLPFTVKQHSEFKSKLYSKIKELA